MTLSSLDIFLTIIPDFDSRARRFLYPNDIILQDYPHCFVVAKICITLILF